MTRPKDDLRLLDLRLGLWQYRKSSEMVHILRTHGPIEPDVQGQLIAMAESDPVLQRFPLRADYMRRILKALIATCSDEGTELAETLLDAYTQMVVKMENAGNWGHRTYYYQPTAEAVSISDALLKVHLDGLLAAPEMLQQPASPRCSERGLVTVRVSDNMLQGGTGCHAWEAGFLLAEFVLSNSHLFKGKRCLEVGCGAGLVGVALHHATAGTGASIMLTDADQETLSNCRHNLQLNGIPTTHAHSSSSSSRMVIGCQLRTTGRVGAEPAASTTGILVQALDWADGAQGLAPDVVLGADLLYDPAAVPYLVALLVELMQLHCDASAASSGWPPAAMPQPIVSGDAPCCCPAVDQRPTAYLATKKRNEATLELFLGQASVAGLRVEDISSLAHNAAIQFVSNATVQERSEVILHRIVASNLWHDTTATG